MRELDISVGHLRQLPVNRVIEREFGQIGIAHRIRDQRISREPGVKTPDLMVDSNAHPLA
jgi:hypothetical protein